LIFANALPGGLGVGAETVISDREILANASPRDNESAQSGSGRYPQITPIAQIRILADGLLLIGGVNAYRS
jgi:hypothetical protein